MLSLYEYLYHSSQFNAAWDRRTGSGQVAHQLVKRFNNVIATDISAAQLDHALKSTNINYKLASAENSEIGSQSIDLVTVAQAIHWFDFNRFYKEVCRVAKPECLLAYWGYDLPKIEPAVDKTVIHFHDEALGDYWDIERGYWRKNIQIFYTH
ncbi:MAG: class I SAM-dependent methyltransferase [Bacteroidota bacterium]